MPDNDYENYSDDDYLAELKDYVDAAKKEKEQDEAERRKQLAEMVGGYMGLWWYLRSFSAATARNIRTYAAIADREAKVAAWKSAADRDKELSQYRDLSGSNDQQVMIINEFGACQYCLPYVGKTYSLGDAQTLVPFHPNCRCTLVRVEENNSVDGLIAGATAAIAMANGSHEAQSDEERVSNMIEVGDLSPLTTVDDYLSIKKSLENNVIGLQTSDGRVVSEISNHFVDRTIGGGWQDKKVTPWVGRRSGVTIEEIIQVLQQGKVSNDKFDPNQVHYVIKGVAEVSFNTRDNRLIQVNPK